MSLTSATLSGYKNSYSFSTLLTQNELSAISYFNNLLKDLLNAKGSLLTSESILDSVQRDFPYFRLGHRNKNNKKISIIIFYDVLNRQLNIVKQDVVDNQPTPIPEPAPAQPPVSAPKPTPAPAQNPTPAPKPVGVAAPVLTSAPAPTQVSQQSNIPAGYELISSSLRSQ